MRIRVMTALLLAMVAVGPSAVAQQAPDPGGIRSETQRRLAQQGDDRLPWDVLGLVGLLGLLGLKKDHSEDSYHPASVE